MTDEEAVLQEFLTASGDCEITAADDECCRRVFVELGDDVAQPRSNALSHTQGARFWAPEPGKRSSSTWLTARMGTGGER